MPRVPTSRRSRKGRPKKHERPIPFIVESDNEDSAPVNGSGSKVPGTDLNRLYHPSLSRR